MKSTSKRMVSFLLAFCVLFGFTACKMESSTGIDQLTIAPIDDIEFYTGIVYGGLRVDIDQNSDYTTKDIHVVVADNDIIDISFKTRKTQTAHYISYEIICKSAGITSFYFETSDKLVRSKEVEVVVSSNIKAIHFDDTSEIHFDDQQIEVNRSFAIDSYQSVYVPQSALEFISEDPSVATIEYDTTAKDSDRCIIKKVGAGETFIYIQTEDRSIQSKKIKVVVEEEVQEEVEEKPQKQSVEKPKKESEKEATSTVEKTPVDHSRTVYITPYGKKYHYSKSCAGGNAKATTEDSAKLTYDPCKKCAQ